MEQEPREPVSESADELDTLEWDLAQAEPSEAPKKAEEIARRLGSALDDVDGGAGSSTP